MFVHGKVNKIVQFKVKDIPKEDLVILSRKAVGQEVLAWVQKELQPRNGSTVEWYETYDHMGYL